MPFSFAAERQRMQVTVNQQQLAACIGRGHFQREQHRQRYFVSAAQHAFQFALGITHGHHAMKFQLQTRITGTHPRLSHRFAFSQCLLKDFAQRLIQLVQWLGLLFMQIGQQLSLVIGQLHLLKLLGQGSRLPERGFHRLWRVLHVL